MSKLTVFYILDISSNMIGERIDKLNLFVEKSKETLEELSQKNVKVKIAMMKFSKTCDWETPHGPEPIEDFDVNYFSCSNETGDFDVALSELNEKLSDTNFFKASEKDSLPIIVFVTSEEINENKEKISQLAKNNVWNNVIKTSYNLKDNISMEIIGKDASILSFSDINDFKRIIGSTQGISDDLAFLISLFKNKKNYKEAYKFLKLSAEHNNAFAQYWLGIFYRDGYEGVEQNFKEAFNYFSKSADQGNADSQYCLGCLFLEGKGVSKNSKEAFKYIKLSADQGLENAIYCLGIMYKNGIGVNQDLDNAIKFLKLSANQGNSDAQDQLGRILFSKNDYKEAERYFELSAKQGNRHGIVDLDSLRNHYLTKK